MKWKKFTIQTTTAAEDFISEKLSEIGIEGIEIEAVSYTHLTLPTT